MRQCINLLLHRANFLGRVGKLRGEVGQAISQATLMDSPELRSRLTPYGRTLAYKGVNMLPCKQTSRRSSETP
jgi:hypothetical protein